MRDVTITMSADSAEVKAGEDIGFTLTVTNDAYRSRQGVDDRRPARRRTGDSDAGRRGQRRHCAITGTPPTETLNRGPVDLATGESSTAHVTSGTTVDSCGTYDNTATFTTTNDGTDEASDSTEVLCSTTTKTADNAKVNAGEDIGFNVTVTASSTVVPVWPTGTRPTTRCRPAPG